jgi:hypothetical protein
MLLLHISPSFLRLRNEGKYSFLSPSSDLFDESFPVAMANPCPQARSGCEPAPEKIRTTDVDSAVELDIVVAASQSSANDRSRRSELPRLRRQLHRRGIHRRRNYALHDDEFQEILFQLRLGTAGDLPEQLTHERGPQDSS